jgi:protocatechuate 3,4-dioxygenase beta subunit
MTKPDAHDLHLGLKGDLDLMRLRLAERRRVLGWMLSGGAAALVGACGGSSSGSTSSSSTSSTSSTSGSGSSSSTCVADPTETNGPYPADGTNTVNGSVANVLLDSGVVRSDIRSSFGTSTTEAPGVPLTLTISLENTNGSCATLSGYAIYIWHCNRSGEYSLYSSDIQSENYLRGVQVTDSVGQVVFETIFPGCYSGRYPHIHVEVYSSLAMATSGSNAALVTQMAMPRDIASTVYDTATGYSASVANLAAVTTSSDGVFASSTTAQISAQTPSLTGSVTDGYSGTITVGVGV